MSDNNLQEYPEHLNPFKSRRSSFSKSFRKVFRSFTGKDKQRPQQQVDIRQQRHTIQPVSINQSPQTQVYSPTALPRSRFKERLEKTENLKRTSKEKHWYDEEYNAANPFEEDEPKKTDEDKIPIPAVRTKHRKRKKRTAPLPPGLTSSDGQYLDVPSRNGSKWSLTSTDTDASSLCVSEYDETENYRENNQEILEMTRKIVEFIDDTNNNVAVTSDITINVQDVDSSSKEQVEQSKVSTEEEKPENKDEEKNMDEQNENAQPEKEIESSTEQEIREDVEPKEEEGIVKIESDKQNSIMKEDNSNIVNEDTPKINEDTPKINEDTLKINEETTTKVDVDNNKEKPISNGCAKNIESDGEKIDHNQNSLVRVKIIDNEEVVLRRPLVIDDSPTESENYSIKQKIEHFESYRSSSPPAKVRQTILTKEKLLGMSDK